MTKDEALKMAIEALETAEIQSEYDGLSNLIFKAIQACKEALEQPAQEPVGWMSSGGVFTKLKSEAQLWVIKGGSAIPLYIDFAPQPAQEPVAFCKHGVPKGVCTLGEKDCNPAPSWQGLDAVEVSNIFIRKEVNGDATQFARAIEQALKEKNS